MSFIRFRQKHDPDDQLDWCFLFRLSSGESITSAGIDVVDAVSLDIDAATDLTVSQVSFGRISGTLWGVTGWVTGGGAASSYTLRCRGQTDSHPLPRKFDKTMILTCEQT